MALSSRIKNALNLALNPVGLHLNTTLEEDRERRRLQQMAERGHFEGPAYPLLECMCAFDPHPLSSAYQHYCNDLARLMAGGTSPGLYEPDNGYFKTPDAEVLYLMVRSLAPDRILEVGCGNSTRIIRQAISDGQLASQHIAIDPMPRVEIGRFVDKLYQQEFETSDFENLLSGFGPNDIVFVDSSHQVAAGNDVTTVFTRLLPMAPAGVVFHVHDVFLPYEYPAEWLADRHRPWAEQTLLHIYLSGHSADVLWPGHYAQRGGAFDLSGLPFADKGCAQSFWFRKSTS
ncbi:hypothetical protein BN1012_Phect849 [Candidatus Phaeomarinobacter ectocarpi]|uniref:Class I SAM-dependent methyltransferase n=1 Tax=Candidatus Phaeomarinibacter ectocarpi TaxID=1458461 RepID=X5M7E7_9HYPH|nr:class I SAM-dependent methyltransferase [Candidatus Phaeomarinobacter ectocarpi]CDO59063.1 hypothetical protein BN1012_Phect849 [Candidatus Phaeomarinobacter ectocarpi]